MAEDINVDLRLSTLIWWRELVDLNPADLAPRMDEVIQKAKDRADREAEQRLARLGPL